MRYITTTKNLFDVNNLTPYTPDNLPNIAIAGVYKGNIIARASTGDSASHTYKTLKELCPSIDVGKTYTIHFDTTATGDQAQTIYLMDSRAIWENGSSRTIEASDLTSDVLFYANYPKTTIAIISNFQLEEGSIATPYVPYGYLPMYKGRYKISDVCQLLDKSKYPATQTKYGVTFTNNGDGTITLNGTAIESRIFYLCQAPAIKGHKYLQIGCPEGGAYNKFFFETSWGNELGSGLITTFTKDQTYGECYIRVIKDFVFSNLTFKPQLFDLTEMYGTGNEPATVAEFKEKFSDDLYLYSPQCWAKIKSLIYKDNIDYIKMK